MANFTSFTSMETPIPFISAASSSSSTAVGAVDDNFEDACSICLEPFTSQNPATVTGCKHEYHLQCILDWSQRSKECPICWQLLVLKEAASQELLAAVASERQSRTRNISGPGFRTLQNFHEDFDAEEDDSDFDERVMQHLAFAASRARYVRRNERQTAYGLGASEVLFFTSSSHVPEEQRTHLTSPGECPSLSYGSSDGDSPTSGTPLATSVQHPSSIVPLVGSLDSRGAVNGHASFKPRFLLRQLPPESPTRSGTSEMLTFSESVKSKWSAASARCKESFSKGTRGLKEKLLARNNSVKELSRGVQREMSAGIAGVTRMIERLDISSKRTGASVPPSERTSNFFFKGKGVQLNNIVHSVNTTNGEIAHDLNSGTPSSISDAVPTQLEVSHAK